MGLYSHNNSCKIGNHVQQDKTSVLFDMYIHYTLVKLGLVDRVRHKGYFD